MIQKVYQICYLFTTKGYFRMDHITSGWIMEEVSSELSRQRKEIIFETELLSWIWVETSWLESGLNYPTGQISTISNLQIGQMASLLKTILCV